MRRVIRKGTRPVAEQGAPRIVPQKLIEEEEAADEAGKAARVRRVELAQPGKRAIQMQDIV